MNKIDEKDIDFYMVNGYLKVDGFVAADELQRLQEEAKTLVDYALSA